MSEETKVASGADDLNSVNDDQSKSPENEIAALAAHNKKLLGEKKAASTRLTETTAELEALRAEKAKTIEDSKLKNEEYKSLWESQKEEAARVKAELGTLKGDITNGEKLNAFEKILGSKLKKDEYYNFVDTDKIVIDETGSIVEESVKLAVETFRASFGDDLLDTKAAGKLPNSGVSQDKMAPIGFEAEIKAAKSQKAFDAVMKKYNK